MKKDICKLGLVSALALLTGCFEQDGSGLPSQVLYKEVKIQVIPVDTDGSNALARFQVELHNDHSIEKNSISVKASDGNNTQVSSDSQPQQPGLPYDSPIHEFPRLANHLYSFANIHEIELYGDYVNTAHTLSVNISNGVFSNVSSSIELNSLPTFLSNFDDSAFSPSDIISLNWVADKSIDFEQVWFIGCNNKLPINILNNDMLEIDLSKYSLSRDYDSETGNLKSSCEVNFFLEGKKVAKVNEKMAGGEIALYMYSLPLKANIVF